MSTRTRTSTRTRMGAALALVAVALGTVVTALPSYLEVVRRGLADPAAGAAPAAPAALMWGALAGLAALVLVVVEQRRRQEYGWLVASVLLSYAGITAYAVRTLLRPLAAEESRDLGTA